MRFAGFFSGVAELGKFSMDCGWRVRGAANLALLAALLAFGCSSSSVPPPSLAITHVTLIDATGAAPQADMTVFIADEQIAAIGASKSMSIPRSTRTVDGTGKFLMPGLVDIHAHLTGASEPSGSREFILPLMLANGITTVRDMGGYLESLVPLRREIETGKLVAARIFFAGPYLDGKPPFFQPSLVVTNATEAAADIHSLTSQGVDFIKVQ
jgi:predicted amidohydrolase YtcJ